jgi:hypothetical protein
MIARLWKGWTRPEDADAYERLLREQVLPGLLRGQGSPVDRSTLQCPSRS